jgi:hypothetical protein
VANMENKKGSTEKDVTLTFPTPGYVKQTHSGKAEDAGDQSKLPSPAPKGGVTPTKRA